MAKGARASSKKANNQRLKQNVFGPIEAARQARLSAKLMEIASQPKPVREEKMVDVTEAAEDEPAKETKEATVDATAMEVDAPVKASTKSRTQHKVGKRRTKSKIVFASYHDRKRIPKKKK